MKFIICGQYSTLAPLTIYSVIIINACLSCVQSVQLFYYFSTYLSTCNSLHEEISKIL